MASRTKPALIASLLIQLQFMFAAAQTVEPAGISIRTIGEILPRQNAPLAAHGDLQPANHVVGGDEIVYTVEIHNATSRTILGVAVTHPVPEHMLYVADSAVGPAADVSFSVDNGQHFAKPAWLRVPLPGGGARPASTADYTHIRWALKNGLRGNATAFARFRAVLKK